MHREGRIHLLTLIVCLFATGSGGAGPRAEEKQGVEEKPATVREGAGDEVDVLAGHSYHGEVFNEGPRQKAYLMEGTGRVRLPITTGDERVQAFFDQGAQFLFSFTPEEAAKFPPVRHRLVRTNKNTGRKSVLIGAHAKCIVGWPEDRSRALLDGLLARAAKPENSFRHEWRDGDVVVWDNQAAVHRATPYDTERYRRVMERTTITFGGAPEFPVGTRSAARA